MEIDRNGMEVLSREECGLLLRSTSIGRVAVSMGALPAVFPVNFAVWDRDIVFRTGHGTKLEAAVQNTVVAFEVDAVDSIAHSGWSVLVTGRAHVIADPDELAEAERLPLLPWAPRGNKAFVRIRGELISGRRLDPLLSLTTEGV